MYSRSVRFPFTARGIARAALTGGALALAIALAPLAQASALDQFRAFVASTKAASGEFTQRQVRTETSSVRPAAVSSGNFSFSRPGRFIWTYTKPYEQVLQADGEKLYIYDRDLNQVTVRKLGDALGSSPAAILFGSNDLERNFDLEDAGSKDGLEWLRALPKAKDTTFESIGIGLRAGVPVAMELRDNFGQLTLLGFTRFDSNPALSDTSFRFAIPAGADVLEQ